MVDISRIDLQTLDKENLEKVKLMLDINKIQADIEMTRQSIAESQERMQLNKDRYQADLEQMRQSVALSQATVEKMRIENDKFIAETKKLEKEARLYPVVPILIALIALLVAVFK